MDQIDISIIMLTCNRTERFRDSLQTNQAELEPFSTEWWVINNGHETVELPPDPTAPTRLIQMPHNGGTGSRNAVLDKVNGACILMLDDDAYIPRKAVERAYQHLQQHPGAGGIILPVKNEGCLLPTIFHGCAVLLSTAALEAVGGYPTDYLYYGEEYEVSFKLTAAGYPLLQAAPDTPATHHVRDGGGRNMDHILYRLVRNNTCCWARSLPFRHLGDALYDTLHRYHAVSIKENSRSGYRRGLAAIPAALIRGLFSRHALDAAAFGQISLNTALEETAHQLLKQNIRHVVFCGLGKFPSGWIRLLKKRGLRVAAFLEHNHGFHGRALRGIPILPPEALSQYLTPHTALIGGTTSAPANHLWKETLETAGCTLTIPGKSIQVWMKPTPSSKSGRPTPPSGGVSPITRSKNESR